MPVDPDIPCNISSLLKVRSGKLEWLQILRSNDLFLGVPYNFVQFTSLQEVLAGWLGLAVGDYVHLSDSLHFYESDREHLESTSHLKAENNTDSLSVKRELSDELFVALASSIEAFTQPNLTEKKLNGLIEEFCAPQAFRNLLLVVAAEAARRHKWTGLITCFMAECTNPALTQIWKHWSDRVQDARILTRKTARVISSVGPS